MSKLNAVFAGSKTAVHQLFWVFCAVLASGLLWACAKEPADSATGVGPDNGTSGDEAAMGEGGNTVQVGRPGNGGQTMQGSSGGRGGGSGGNPGSGGTKPAASGGNPGSGGSTSGGGGMPAPIQTGCNGYATRFWDCCKPHCSWPNNVSGGAKPANSCSANNAVVDAKIQSSCNGGGAHMCSGLTPWAVNSNLAYGFAATSSGDVCGRCFQLQFTGASHNGGNDQGSKALTGKTMIVQAINIGFDVGGGQFDIAIPGGGVGAFNACSAQWGVSNNELGAQYGGFLAVCRQQNGNNHDAVKSCVLQKCTSVFQSRGLSDLAAACKWSVDWYQAADNPALKYKEVACPAELSGRSGMMRTAVDNKCEN